MIQATYQWSQYIIYLTHLGLVMPYHLVTDLGQHWRMLPDGTKPLPEPVLTYISEVFFYSTVSNSIGNAHYTNMEIILKFTYLKFDLISQASIS